MKEEESHEIMSRGIYPARSWIEAQFQKRECIRFIPSERDEHRCCCGQSFTYHAGTGAEISKRGEIWSSAKHTVSLPTDAYGTIEFQGGPHAQKAQYLRLAHDTRPELIVQMFTREWNLELPKLLITVQGGKANFELQPKLKKVLRKGLLKAAKTTGAWIFTGGTNTGVTRQVGDALLAERSQRSGRVVSIGIAPWGIIENNQELLGHDREVPYHSISSPRSRYAVLNNRHAYFLLVDNGTSGKYGAEIILRRKLEKFISIQKLHPYTYSSTPIVCLVIEGGTNTIRAVLEYVTDTPPVPVVVCDGSGRAADLIAFTHKYASENGEQPVLESMKDYLINTIQRTFEVGLEQAECLYSELIQCTKQKKLITVFRISERSDDAGSHELDQTILTALFKSQHLSPSEQLSLALTWNRVDIARSEIFVYGQEWPPGALEEAMMQALEHDRIDFVKLLLENGVSMKKFLSIPRLEELYNTKQGPSNTLGYILRDVRPHIPRGYVYTLHDIGLVINKLMGGAYRAYYTRRKFRPIYAKVMNKSPHVHRNSTSFIRYCGNALSIVTEALPANKDMALFDYPFNELLIWAVLTKRQEMALLMWQHGEEALAKSLVACKLYKAMAHEAAEDDLETEIYEELRNYGKEFETIALELLDYCYRQDDDQTQQLLTCELQNWSGQTCLSLAVAANHRALLAHPCSQIILADLWMGGLRTRKNTNLKVILCLFIPVVIIKLEFKSKEELQLMPQTEEEHLENESLDEDLVSKGGDHDKVADGEVVNVRLRSMSIRSKSSSQQGIKALISENYSTRDTVVHENGKIYSDAPDEYKEFLHIPLDYYEMKQQNRPLRLKKKFYEFYTAPITKFWSNSIAYIIFLTLFSFTVLVKMEPEPSWQEYYSIFYITSMGFEKIREIISSEPVAIRHKFSVWAWNMWNPCDAAAIMFFLIGLSLRLRPSTTDIGRVIYCVDSIYWYLRILNILGVNKYLGPLVTMMGKMVKNMIYFVILLVVVLMSFGVSRQAILFPHSDPSWFLVREIFYKPYFMLYGEVFADSIDPPCGDQPGMEPCQPGRWITIFGMATYLLVANILLINLLIAVFNNIFIEVNAVSHQVWMFQRFTVVMEYEQKPVLPPPLIVFCHIYLLLKFLARKIKGQRETYDNGLKLFLEKDDLERLYDFEEECVEGYFREKELKLQQSTDERIKQTNERVENLTQKIEDINQKENTQQSALQSVEFRMRKLEEIAEQTASHLAVIHRFMATHTRDLKGLAITDIPIPDVKLINDRLRKTSDRSSTDETHGHGSHPHGPGNASESFLSIGTGLRRRGPARSLTEVRPDNFMFDDGIQFEVKPVAEEEEISDQMTLRSNDSLSASGRRHRISLEEKQRSNESKASPIEEVNEEEKTQDFDNNSANGSVHVSIESLRRKRYDSTGGTTAGGRRSSEGGGPGPGSYYVGDDSDRGTFHVPTVRRQFSRTQSEPDNSDSVPASHPSTAVATASTQLERQWVQPGIKVIPPCGTSLPSTSGRAMLLAMHAEYTSITDELETMCGLLSPPCTPRLLSPPRPTPSISTRGTNTTITTPRHHRKRHTSEMSNPEMALYLEKEHLRDAEESDYLVMENLIQRRYDPDGFGDDINEFLNVVHETKNVLRRASAVEGDGNLMPGDGDVETGDLLMANESFDRMSSHVQSEATSRQNSGDTNQTSSSDFTNKILSSVCEKLPPRPSIKIDSSQLPKLKQSLSEKSDDNISLHATQSETMC